MSAIKDLRSASGNIAAHLRWFTSASALVDRSDRQEALIVRYEQINARLSDVEKVFALFTAYCLEVSVDDFTLDQRTRVSEDYAQILDQYDTIAEAARRLTAARDGKPILKKELSGPPPGPLSRLPTLDLPHFDGCLESYLGFINLFDSLVDARADLRPSQKLAYLMSVLDSEAKGLIQHLPVSDETYKTARDLITRRYHNKRGLADTHIEQILSLPSLNRVSGLRTQLLNPLLVATNALKSLDLPVDQWSYLLVHIVLKKLPADLRSRFEQRFGGDSATYLPPFGDLERFLEDECRLLDNSGGDTSVKTQPPKVKEQARVHPRGNAFRPRFAATQSQVECSYCKVTGHRTASCNAFLALHVASRRRIAKARRLCFSCLGLHYQRDCTSSRPCLHCGGQHLDILCMNAREVGRSFNQPEPRTGGCFEDGSRGSPVHNRDSPRRLDRHSPRLVEGTRSAGTPPPSRDCATVERRQHHEYCRYSPPLAERPRLESRAPRFGRVRHYDPPQMARGTNHRAFEEFRPHPHFDLPGPGQRSPPRQQ